MVISASLLLCGVSDTDKITTRSKIVVSSRRPPPTMWIDPRVEFVAADFLEPPQKVSESLKSPCKDVTHVYFTSYVHNDDLSKLAEKNVPLFKNFMDVMEQVCPKLERVCLQTGGKVRNLQCEH